MELSYRLEGRFIKNPAGFLGDARKIIMRGINNACSIVQREVVVRTPEGATGLLRKYWIIIPDEFKLEGRVRNEVPGRYGIHVEFGTKPHLPPYEPIAYWARRKLHNEEAAKTIRWHIKWHGTKAQKFTEAGLNAARPAAEKELERIGGEIIKEAES